MRTSCLYSFLALHAKKNSLVPSNKIELKKDQHEKNYAFIHLPLEKFHFDHKTLINHHISIYQERNEHKDFRNKFHYTADFLDNDNNTYRVHFYFNQHNHHIKTTFSQLKDDAYQIILPDDELQNALKNVILANIIDIIQKIEALHKNYLENLKKSYQVKKEKLLQANANNDIKQYSSGLNDIIDLLKEIIPISYLKEHTAHLHLFNAARKAIKIIMFSSSQPENINIENKKEDDEAWLDEADEISEPSISHQYNEVSITELIEQAENHEAEFLKEKNNLRKKVDLFLTFDRKVSDILIQTTYSAITHEELISIDQLISHRNEKAKKLLTQVLLTNPLQAELASELKKFIKIFAHDFATIALNTKNTVLLDCVLSNCDLEPDNDEFLIKQQPAMLACYSAHSATNNMESCFGVLLKYELSLTPLTSNGLSVAYHILSNLHHDLFLELIRHMKKPQLSKLISFLQVEIKTHLNNKTLDQDTKLKLKAAKESLPKLAENFENFYTEKPVQDYCQNLAENIAIEKLIALKEDKEIKAKHLIYHEIVKECVILEGKKIEKMQQDEVEVIKNNIPLTTFNRLNFNDLKEVSLKFYAMQIASFTERLNILKKREALNNTQNKRDFKALKRDLNSLNHLPPLGINLTCLDKMTKDFYKEYTAYADGNATLQDLNNALTTIGLFKTSEKNPRPNKTSSLTFKK